MKQNCLPDRIDLESVHTNARIVHLQLAKPCVNDENDTVDR